MGDVLFSAAVSATLLVAATALLYGRRRFASVALSIAGIGWGLVALLLAMGMAA